MDGAWALEGQEGQVGTCKMLEKVSLEQITTWKSISTVCIMQLKGMWWS